MGWVCPSCRRAYAPHMVMCSYCPAEPVTSTSTNQQPAVDFIAKGHLGTPCPKPRDGGLCGCDEDEETGPPKVCLSSECDCV
jgi:hypothetical protein